MSKENPSISTDFILPDKVPLPKPIPFPQATNQIDLNKISNGTFYTVLQFMTDHPNISIKEEKEQSFIMNVNRSKSVLSLLGIIGGLWSTITALYIFLFGLGSISPWGFMQKKLFKNKYKEKLLPFVVDLQSGEFDTKEKSNIKENKNSSMQKRLDNLEKRVRLYENIIDISLLTSIEKDSSSPNVNNGEMDID
ncbi:28731_t:CDS:2 [Dentiscutata erythropus]|uniref:28731_t:CDS:1 n=1 Tax=Dentiscutata erythropus TaxID=1348616 RepID=A0A9N9J230_9GLOM|nr:28731_t:CDS:2 [Dentiscutata erythropus]